MSTMAKIGEGADRAEDRDTPFVYRDDAANRRRGARHRDTAGRGGAVLRAQRDELQLSLRLRMHDDRGPVRACDESALLRSIDG